MCVANSGAKIGMEAIGEGAGTSLVASSLCLCCWREDVLTRRAEAVAMQLEVEELRDLRDLRDVPKAELRTRKLKLRRMIVHTDELVKLCDLELAGVAKVAFAELGCKACECV